MLVKHEAVRKTDSEAIRVTVGSVCMFHCVMNIQDNSTNYKGTVMESLLTDSKKVYCQRETWKPKEHQLQEVREACQSSRLEIEEKC